MKIHFPYVQIKISGTTLNVPSDYCVKVTCVNWSTITENLSRHRRYGTLAARAGISFLVLILFRIVEQGWCPTVEVIASRYDPPLAHLHDTNVLHIETIFTKHLQIDRTCNPVPTIRDINLTCLLYHKRYTYIYKIYTTKGKYEYHNWNTTAE